MGIAMQRQQQKQQQLQHEQTLAQQRRMQEGQFQHASNLQQAGFLNDAMQETRRQQSAIKLQKQQLKAQRRIEEARQTQAERHFASQQSLANQQLAEQVASRVGSERFRTTAHESDLRERQQQRLAQEAQHAATLAEQRRATGVLEGFRQTSHNQNLQQQRDLQSQQLNQQHNQFQQNIAERNVDRAFQAQQARAARSHATLQQREQLAAQEAENTRRMRLERTIHGDNIAERQADRTVSQQQFDAQMRQAKLRDIEQKRMNIESMKLARGKTSHAEWLDKFNANLAHMGLQLKREKLDQLVNGAIEAPDETASSQQKLSWLSGLLSNIDADEGARLDRAFRRDDSLHDRQLNRVSTMTQLRLGQLSARERLNAQNRETRENIFTQILAPIAVGAAKAWF
jgi:hypothetical protein